MLQVYAGGKSAVVNLIQASPYTAPCCEICQKKSPSCCNNTLHILILQFMTVRPLLFLFIAILERQPEKFHSLIRFLTSLTSLSLIVAMIALIRAYHILAPRGLLLRPTIKILFVKGIVLMLVIQQHVISSYQKTGMFGGSGPTLEET
jgi:hypothetical protein